MDREDLSRLLRGTGLAEDQLVRELLQAKLIGALFASNTRKAFALKGGLAMHMLHGSRRMTKDVDLQGDPTVPPNGARAAVREAIKSTLSLGLLEDIHSSEPKQTDTVQRFKIGGRIVGGGTEVHLTVEVSRRGMPPGDLIVQAPLVGPTPDTSGALVDVYSAGLIALNKVDALLSPNRVAPRDVWDLHVLVIAEIKPPMKLLASLGEDALKEATITLWDKLEMMDHAMAVEQLAPFLGREDNASLDKESWDEMRLTVGTRVQEWLEEARGYCS